MSASAACAARNTLRPMRPKPLIPTRTGILGTSFLGVLELAACGRGPPPLAPGAGNLLGLWRRCAPATHARAVLTSVAGGHVRPRRTGHERPQRRRNRVAEPVGIRGSGLRDGRPAA